MIKVTCLDCGHADLYDVRGSFFGCEDLKHCGQCDSTKLEKEYGVKLE